MCIRDSLTFSRRINVYGLYPIAVHPGDDPFDVQDDFRHIFLHTGDRGKFVLHTGDPDGRRGSADVYKRQAPTRSCV